MSTLKCINKEFDVICSLLNIFLEVHLTEKYLHLAWKEKILLVFPLNFQ